MAENNWTIVNDTIKGIAGIGGIQAIEAVHTFNLTEVSQLIAYVAQGIIAALTIASLLKSLFSPKNK